jgi:predicted PurR-regulated permease PerM
MTTQPAEKSDLLRRFVLVLAALIGTTVVLYYGRELFILLFVPALLAFLMLPLSRRMDKAGLPEWAGALTCTLLLISVAGLLIAFLAGQYASFGTDLPGLNTALTARTADIQAWLEDAFHLDRERQVLLYNKEMGSLSERGGAIAMQLLSATGATLAILVPIPLFVFFLLLLKGKFHLFLHKLSEQGNGAVLKVAVRTSKLARKWMRGVLVVMGMLAVINSLGFLALGLKHAILLGVTAAVLNIIPYIGPWLGALLAMLIALLTKDSGMYVVGALGVVLFSQFIDNNFITPKVVGSSVSINPLASLVALFAGGMLWGVVGMVLAIPVMGILKIICDEVPGLGPWGFLIGEEREWPEEERISLPFTSPPSAGKKKK